jgi:hypothetical protein
MLTTLLKKAQKKLFYVIEIRGGVDAGLDKEMIAKFKQVQLLNKDDKKTVLFLLDAYIAKGKIQNILAAQ